MDSGTRRLARAWMRIAFTAGALLMGVGGTGYAQPPELRDPRPQPSEPGSAGAVVDRIANWRADLDFLAAELPARHKNAFFKCPRERWEARVEELRGRLPEWSDAQVLVAFRQLVAMLGDSHSNVWADKASVVSSPRLYPVACAWLSDGVYPAVLPKEHAGLIGRRLVRVGGQPINEVIDRLGLVQAADNESGRKNQAMATLREADTLAALGIVKDIDAAEWTLADQDGNQTTISVGSLVAGASGAGIMAQRPEPSLLGLSRAFRRVPHGHKLLADSRTLYLWYDRCEDAPDRKVSAFCEDALRDLDEALAADPPAVDRVVIDLRRNGGGNSLLLAPLIDGLSRREGINRKGRLYALIGRRTFSSAVMNAYQLRDATRCLLVGEPTGGSPNGYGEVRQFRLPNSKLVVQYSTKLFKGPPGDAVNPDIAVEEDAEAYFDPARDAVLDAAIGHRGE